MLKLVDDLQNIIITYLDPATYSILSTLSKEFSITRYENLYTNDLRKRLAEISDNIILRSLGSEIFNLFLNLKIFEYIIYKYRIAGKFKSRNEIRLKITKLENFCIHNLNATKSQQKKLYGVFHLDSDNNLLLLDDIYFSRNKDDIINGEVISDTPLWKLLKEFMIKILIYSVDL